MDGHTVFQLVGGVVAARESIAYLLIGQDRGRSMSRLCHDGHRRVIGVRLNNVIRQHVDIDLGVLASLDVPVVNGIHTVDNIGGKIHVIQGIVVTNIRIPGVHIDNLDDRLGCQSTVPCHLPSMPVVVRRKLVLRADILPIDFQLQFCGLDLSINHPIEVHDPARKGIGGVGGYRYRGMVMVVTRPNHLGWVRVPSKAIHHHKAS